MNPLRQRAVHEAGHALVAHLLHEVIDGVSARKDPLGEHAGFTKLARPEEITMERIRDRLAVLCAGEIADLYAGADEEYREWASKSDRADAIKLAEALAGGSTRAAALISEHWRAARLRAAVLLSGHWRALQSFAEDLERRMSMNGEAAHVLIGQAIRKHGVDVEAAPGLKALTERLERQTRPRPVLLEEFSPLIVIRRIA